LSDSGVHHGEEDQTMRHVVIVLTFMSLLAACGEPKPELQDTVFDTQLRALQKARETEEVLKQGERQRREALEAAEGKPAY
jgi:hypothetical protein